MLERDVYPQNTELIEKVLDLGFVWGIAVIEGTAMVIDAANKVIEITQSKLVTPSLKEALFTYGEGLKVMGVSVAASILGARTGDSNIHDTIIEALEKPRETLDELFMVALPSPEDSY